MKKIIVLVACFAIATASIVILTGFVNNARENGLKAKIIELEKQIAGISQTPAECSFNNFNSSEELAKFIAKNATNPAYSINTVGVSADSIRNAINDFTKAYKGTVYFSIVHTTRSTELQISSLESKICNISLCCPPRCRNEPFGLLTIPRRLSIK
jgi:hypothetical protein